MAAVSAREELQCFIDYDLDHFNEKDRLTLRGRRITVVGSSIFGCRADAGLKQVASRIEHLMNEVRLDDFNPADLKKLRSQLDLLKQFVPKFTVRNEIHHTDLSLLSRFDIHTNAENGLYLSAVERPDLGKVLVIKKVSKGSKLQKSYRKVDDAVSSIFASTDPGYLNERASLRSRLKRNLAELDRASAGTVHNPLKNKLVVELEPLEIPDTIGEKPTAHGEVQKITFYYDVLNTVQELRDTLLKQSVSGPAKMPWLDVPVAALTLQSDLDELNGEDRLAELPQDFEFLRVKATAVDVDAVYSRFQHIVAAHSWREGEMEGYKLGWIDGDYGYPPHVVTSPAFLAELQQGASLTEHLDALAVHAYVHGYNASYIRGYHDGAGAVFDSALYGSLGFAFLAGALLF